MMTGQTGTPEVPCRRGNEGSEADASIEVDEVEATAEPAPSRWLDEADRSWGDEQPLAPLTLGTVTPEPEPTTTEALDETAPDGVEPIMRAAAKVHPLPSMKRRVTGTMKTRTGPIRQLPLRRWP
jgi:hypothetical protein